ncbi:MAG: hypothetical protein AB8I08_22865 [Sandaracinaceae bacterium]
MTKIAPFALSLLLLTMPTRGLAQDDEPSEDEAAEPSVASPEEAAAEAEAEEADEPEPSGATDMAAYAEQLRQRQEIGTIHRAFGIATWGAMLATVVLGTIQFHNLYGGFGGPQDTPCVQGNAVFGSEQCWGVPYPHLISAAATTALYTSTFVLSFMMPDPDNLSEGDSQFAQTLNIHKILRWVHFGGMLAQIGLGILVANSSAIGLDRANNYDAQLALAAIHQGVGWVTFGALTAAGALMVF